MYQGLLELNKTSCGVCGSACCGRHGEAVPGSGAPQQHASLTVFACTQEDDSQGADGGGGSQGEEGNECAHGWGASPTKPQQPKALRAEQVRALATNPALPNAAYAGVAPDMVSRGRRIKGALLQRKAWHKIKGLCCRDACGQLLFSMKRGLC